MAWEENSRICLNMQLIAILSRIGVDIASCRLSVSLYCAHTVQLTAILEGLFDYR